MQPTDCPNANPSSQWLFPVSALLATPTLTTSNGSLKRELYDRARGIEFLFRLGSSLALSSPTMFTAATWFHRFYMRYSMEDYHRQDVAATCIFLATKTEECGRKLRDVARVCQAKSGGVDIAKIPPESKEVEKCQAMILLTEEVLLEALCFDFVVDSPHAVLVDLFDTYGDNAREYAWSIAHDSYRSPLCILYSPKTIAIACFILAQHMMEGCLSPSLDARISPAAPSASLPTPPSLEPSSPDPSRFAIDDLCLTKEDRASVAETLSILLEFYSAQDIQGSHPYLSSLAAVTPPTTSSARPRFYSRPAQSNTDKKKSSHNAHGPTPNSSHGSCTPVMSSSHEPPLKEHEQSASNERLDLS